MSDLNLPDEPTTAGRDHWFVVCAKDEQHANLVGPFFTPEAAAEEVRLTNEQVAANVIGACDLPHFITRGPMPETGQHLFGVKRPTLYDNAEGHDWWEWWAYGEGGELREKRRAELQREREEGWSRV